jgi:hypothetical protein
MSKHVFNFESSGGNGVGWKCFTVVKMRWPREQKSY